VMTLYPGLRFASPWAVLFCPFGAFGTVGPAALSDFRLYPCSPFSRGHASQGQAFDTRLRGHKHFILCWNAYYFALQASIFAILLRDSTSLRLRRNQLRRTRATTDKTKYKSRMVLMGPSTSPYSVKTTKGFGQDNRMRGVLL
jgi:hypothetical protein